MAEQVVDTTTSFARRERLKTALTGIELNDVELASLETVALLDSEVVHDLAVLIERARYAGLGGSSRTEVIPLPVVPGGKYEPKHKAGGL